MTTGEEIYTVFDQSDEIGSVVFTPDGQYYLTTGSVPLRLRRLSDGEEVMTIAGPTIWSLDLSSDGRLIYAADVDGMVRIFTLSMEDAIALAYERLGRWWRPDECRRYLHSEDCPPAPAGVPGRRVNLLLNLKLHLQLKSSYANSRGSDKYSLTF
jgi:WD40 repeat protein